MTTDDGGERGAVGNAAVIVAVLGLALAAVAGVTFANVGAPSGEAILDDAESRYDSAETIVGAAQVTITNETDTREYEASFTVAEHNRSRVAITGENRTIVGGSNGSVAWVHDETTGVTRIFDPNATNGTDAYNRSALNESQTETLRTASERLRTLAADWSEENTTATRVGRETIDGTEAWVVEVRPDNESRDGVATYWIGVDSSVLVKQRLSTDNGGVTVRYTDTQFDVSVANSTFQPPGIAGASVQTAETFDELQAATDLTVPELDDPAYTFVEGRVAADGGETAVATYEGPANVSVVATTRFPFDTSNATTIDLGGVTANLTTTDDGTVVVWAEDGVTVAVITDTDRETTVELAASLVGEVTAPAESERRVAPVAGSQVGD